MLGYDFFLMSELGRSGSTDVDKVKIYIAKSGNYVMQYPDPNKEPKMGTLPSHIKINDLEQQLRDKQFQRSVVNAISEIEYSKEDENRKRKPTTSVDSTEAKKPRNEPQKMEADREDINDMSDMEQTEEGIKSANPKKMSKEKQEESDEDMIDIEKEDKKFKQRQTKSNGKEEVSDEEIQDSNQTEYGANGEKNIEFNIPWVQAMLIEADRRAASARGEGVLIIGWTGVGKSTTINYLLGHKMVKRQVKGLNGKFVDVDPTDKPTAKIGHQATQPETLYAEPVIPDKHNKDLISYPWLLIDCPGFQEMRSHEESVIEAVSVELVVRRLINIKRIVLLLDYNTFDANKADGFKKLLYTLVRLFKDPMLILSNSLIIFTKRGYTPEEVAREDVENRILNIVKGFTEEAKKLQKTEQKKDRDGMSAEMYEKIAAALKIMKDGNILFVDPLDNGQSRKQLIRAIENPAKKTNQSWTEFLRDMKDTYFPYRKDKQSTKVGEININIDDFDFNQYSESRILFNTAFYELCGSGLEQMERGKNEQNKFRILEQEIEQLEYEIKDKDDLIDILKNNTHKQSENHNKAKYNKTKDNKLNILHQNEGWIKQEERELESFREELIECEQRLSEIDTSVDCLIYREEFTEKNGWTYSSCEFSVPVLPYHADTPNKGKITKINTTTINAQGEETGEFSSSTGGEGYYEFKTTYNSKFHFRITAPYAKVKAYVQTRDETGNYIEICRLKERIVDLNHWIAESERRIADLKTANQMLQGDIETIESGKELGEEDFSKQDTVLARIAKEEKAQEDRKTLLNTKKVELKKCLEVIKHCVDTFEATRERYECIKNIANLLKFSSPLVKNFCRDYDRFIEHDLKNLQSLAKTFVPDEPSENTDKPSENMNSSRYSYFSAQPDKVSLEKRLADAIEKRDLALAKVDNIRAQRDAKSSPELEKRLSDARKELKSAEAEIQKIEAQMNAEKCTNSKEKSKQSSASSSSSSSSSKDPNSNSPGRMG